MRNLSDITGEERTKLEKQYVRAHRKFFKNKSKIAGDDLVRFRQQFLKKHKISTGV